MALSSCYITSHEVRYFNRQGWPTSSVLGGRAPADEGEQGQLIDTLQDWKTEKYQQMIGWVCACWCGAGRLGGCVDSVVGGRCELVPQQLDICVATRCVA